MNAEIIRSRRKSIEIQICPDGHIRVQAPYFVTNAEIVGFIREKAGWIEKHKKIIEERQREQAVHTQRLTVQDIKELATQAKKVIPDKVRHYADLIGVDYGRITIRNQKTRWGSCSGKGNLNFNCLLMLTPEDIQDYVVIHELCHRKEMNHSPKFWAEVAKIMPDYKKEEKVAERKQWRDYAENDRIRRVESIQDEGRKEA